MSCPRFVRFSVALPAVALLLAGCANSSNSVANANASATANAGAAAPAPAKPPPERFGSYGVSNRGYTTNLASEINGMITGQDSDAEETKVAAASPAGSAPATAAVPGSGTKTAKGGAPAAPGSVAPQQGAVAGQPQVAQNQPQDPPKSKAQQAEENVPGLYGTPRAPQQDMVHWLLETTKDE